VLLCSRCDRGQRYCGRVCSRQARLDSRRDAARRYQRSRAGRMAHAARSRRWRHRRRERERACGDAAASAGSVINFVTHQGCPTPPADAPLVAADGNKARRDTNTSPNAEHCRRCAAPLSPWVRQGFLRHGRSRRWPSRPIDPGP